MSSPSQHRRSFAATYEGVADASLWLRDVAAGMALEGQLLFALEVCLEELFTNVVNHGGAGRAAGGEAPLCVTVGLVPSREPGAVDMVFEDNGKAFDVSLAPGRPIRKPLEEIMPGGLGMQLIRSFSDELLYEALPYGNRVIVKFLRQDPAGAKADA